jgi:hypothetical protein
MAFENASKSPHGIEIVRMSIYWGPHLSVGCV